MSLMGQIPSSCFPFLLKPHDSLTLYLHAWRARLKQHSLIVSLFPLYFVNILSSCFLSFHILRQKLTLKVIFLTDAEDGLIMYNGDRHDGQGDFVSLALSDSILEFRFDLGKGPVIIRSVSLLSFCS